MVARTTGTDPAQITRGVIYVLPPSDYRRRDVCARINDLSAFALIG